VRDSIHEVQKLSFRLTIIWPYDILEVEGNHTSYQTGAYKRKHEQPSPQVCPESRTSNTGVDINNTGSPLLMTCHGSWTGQAVTTTNNSNSNVVTSLSHLLDRQIDR